MASATARMVEGNTPDLLEEAGGCTGVSLYARRASRFSTGSLTSPW